jgi:hypothetical protein
MSEPAEKTSASVVLGEMAESKEAPVRVPFPTTSLVDLLSKAAALILACIYGFGFLVVSLNEAQYGIVEFNVLKPRIFAAGALFTLLIAIPTLAIRRVHRRSLIPESAGQAWLKWSHDMNRYFNMCLLLAIVSYGVLWRHIPLNISDKLSRPQAVALVLCISFSVEITRRFGRLYKTKPEKCRLLPLADFALQNVVVLYVFHGFVGLGSFVYWFFAVGMYAGWLDDRLRDSRKRERLYVELLLIYVLVLATYYARFMYQNLNPSMGGGRLPVVTVYLTQKVSPLDQLQENVYLVDENDSGFYFVRNPAERQAVFVPRSSVASLQFRDQAAGVASK